MNTEQMNHIINTNKLKLLNQNTVEISMKSFSRYTATLPTAQQTATQLVTHAATQLRSYIASEM